MINSIFCQYTIILHMQYVVTSINKYITIHVYLLIDVTTSLNTTSIEHINQIQSKIYSMLYHCKKS